MRHILTVRHALFVCAVLGLLLLLSTTPLQAQPPTYTFEAVADSYVRGDPAWHDDNFGCNPEIGVGMRYGSAPQYGLVQFDPSSLAGRTIASARLQLTIWAWGWGSETSLHRIEVHRLLPTVGRTPWIEGIGSSGPHYVPGNVCPFSDTTGGVSWVTQLKTHVSPPAQVIQYPDYDPMPSATITINRVTHPIGTVVELDVTALVQGWLNGNYPNFGLLLRDANSVGTQQQVGFGQRDQLLRNMQGLPFPPVPGPRLIIQLQNSPPNITATAPSVAVMEGQIAGNTGTVSDIDGDSVLLTALPFGMAINNYDGTWSWSLASTDGPAQSQLITISGDDGNGGIGQTSFSLVVTNVAPAVSAGTDQTVNRNTPVTLTGTWADPAGSADNAYAWSWDVNADGVADFSGSASYGDAAPVTTSFALEGTYPLTFSVTDKDGAAGSDTVMVTVLNQPPICTAATPSNATLWPANHAMIPVTIYGITDPEGDPVSMTITSVMQDEPVNGTGDGDTAPDAVGVGSSSVELRAERAGNGNGRVYHLSYMVTDGHGGVCTAEVLVGVPKSRGNNGAPIDDGAIYNSTQP